MNIYFISVGKLKDDWEKQAFAEYSKRLSAFGTVQSIEIKEGKLSDDPSPKEIERVLDSEAEEIIKKLPRNAAVITMCIEGKKLSSEGLAKTVEAMLPDCDGGICLVLGSSFGLSERVKSLSKLRLSMSDMTFPHRLARIMSAEQLYRAFSIINHSRYHK